MYGCTIPFPVQFSNDSASANGYHNLTFHSILIWFFNFFTCSQDIILIRLSDWNRTPAGFETTLEIFSKKPSINLHQDKTKSFHSHLYQGPFWLEIKWKIVETISTIFKKCPFLICTDHVLQLSRKKIQLKTVEIS
jgi:hypothetical protein